MGDRTPNSWTSRLFDTTRHCYPHSHDTWAWGGVGEPGSLPCCFAFLVMVTLDLCKVPSVPWHWDQSQWGLFTQEKSVSIVPVLMFSDNLLHSPTPRAKGSGHWEFTGQPDSIALFICMECQPPNNCSHISMLCTCPCLRAQLQLVLLPLAGIPTEYLCSSWHTECKP